MAARRLTRIYDDALKPAGVKSTQFTIMVALAQGYDASITQLADALGMERTTLTRNLRVLQRDGLIELSEELGPTARIAVLTEEGHARLAKALPLWKRVQASVINDIGANAWNDAKSALQRLGSGSAEKINAL